MEMTQLVTVFYIVFALAAPVLLVYALVRNRQLSAEVERLSEELQIKSKASEREFASLTSRVHVLEAEAVLKKTAEFPTRAAGARPADAINPAAPLPKSVLEIPAVAPKTPDPQPMASPTIPVVPGPPKPTIAPDDEKKERVAAKPSIPERPAVAARIETPPPMAAFRYAAPKPTMQERIRNVSAMEDTLGTNWLHKLGIIMLVLGIASFGIYEFSAMGAAGKAALLYIASVALLVSGIYFEKKENYRLFGRTFIGGGWALLFFATYGIYHVGAMHVLNSLTLDCILMLVVAVAMGAHTLRYRSQFVTGLAFLLGYTTVALSHDSVYSLSAGVILAIGLVLIVLKMSWFELEVFGILSSYLNHLYWLYRILGPSGAQGRFFPEYHASIAMLLFYWLVFRISYVVRDIKTEFEEHVSTAAAILNALLLLGAMKFQSVQPQLAYLALLGIGLLEFSFAQLPRTRRRREAFVLLSVMGAALMLAAAPFHYSGNNVAILWLVGAEIFLFAGVIVKEVVFRRIGLFTGLLVGIHIAMVDAGPVLEKANISDVGMIPAGILFALSAVVFYGNFVSIGQKWKELFDAPIDSLLVNILSYIAGASAMLAVWALTNRDWTAAVLAGVMVVLALATKRFPSRHLQIQCGAIGLLAFFRMIAANLHLDAAQGTHLSARLITLPIIAAAFYVTAKLAPLRNDSEQNAVRAGFAALGAAVVAMLIYTELPGPWVAVGWIAFAVVLAILARRLKYAQLAWQGNVVAILAALRTVSFNYEMEEKVWWAISLRLVTVSLVATGLYFMSRKGAPNVQIKRILAFLHSFAGTVLLAWLAWYEAPNGWLAPLWVGFALVLALIDRRFEVEELGWQVPILSLLALGRGYAFNLHSTATWYGWSVRLLSLALVAIFLYALSSVVRISKEWRERNFHHTYSWAASTVVGFLLWYELVPLNIAIGWAVFGLVLFEYGKLREIRQFRFQSYVALFASFVRIFFANLSAGEPGHFWNPRTYSILPLVAIYFFIYAQLTSDEPERAKESDSLKGFNVGDVLATLGTATVVALFYFQFPFEWVVTSWAAVVLVVFALALVLNRQIFLFQGMLLTIFVLSRGMVHNLFGSGYFSGGDWKGRFFVLGSAIILLLATLLFAFPLRKRYEASPSPNKLPKYIGWLQGRPEQLQFFVPVTLLTFMLALKMRSGMVTLSWGVEGVMIFLLALAVNERSFRLTGFGLLLLCVGKVVVMDVWGLQPRDRYLTFIIVGGSLLFVSYLYSRYRQSISRLL